MVLGRNAALEKVLDFLAGTLKKVHKMVPKSRTLKSSESSLKLLMVPYDNFFLESIEWHINMCEIVFFDFLSCLN